MAMNAREFLAHMEEVSHTPEFQAGLRDEIVGSADVLHSSKDAYYDAMSAEIDAHPIGFKGLKGMHNNIDPKEM